MSTSQQRQLAHEAAERYERVLVPLILGPAAKTLVEGANFEQNDTVLDVGCGTGAAARFAAEKLGAAGRVIGVYVNAGMLEVARSLPRAEGAAIEWREGSAYDLPLENESVDVVLCAQTLQFLTDRPAALAEMYRVLKPGGRLFLSVWCDLRENPYFHAIVESISKYIGRETAVGLEAAFGLADPQEVRTLIVQAGLSGIEVAVGQVDLNLPEPTEFVPIHVSATRMSTGLNCIKLRQKRNGSAAGPKATNIRRSPSATCTG